MHKTETFQEISIDLRLPPRDRWQLTPQQCQQARELLISYKADLGLAPGAIAFLTNAAKELVHPDLWSEMESLSVSLDLQVSDIALGNFYYDALKVALGCTAFAVETREGILHARNLDWWTENDALARYTAVCRFTGGQAGPFTTIGWPGFIGAFSGIAPGRFAVTLNAVLSLEPAQPAIPVVLVLRRILETARSFNDAARVLSDVLLPCDCLLLLTGTRPGEMLVIERTPSRHAIRHAQDGFICVTNDYQKLNTASGITESDLIKTSCNRFRRVETLVGSKHPQNPEDCLGVLNDPAVQMNITVQQMVFSASTGHHWLKLPRKTNPESLV